MAVQKAILLGLTCLLVSCQAFYLPGVAPQDYAKVWRLYAATWYYGIVSVTVCAGTGRQAYFEGEQAELDEDTAAI